GWMTPGPPGPGSGRYRPILNTALAKSGGSHRIDGRAARLRGAGSGDDEEIAAVEVGPRRDLGELDGVLQAAAIGIVGEPPGRLVVDDDIGLALGVPGQHEALRRQHADLADALEALGRQMELVLAGGEVGDRVDVLPVEIGVEEEGVAAAAAGQRVLAGAAI